MAQSAHLDSSLLKSPDQARRQAFQEQVLQTAVDRGLDVKFSTHAKERLQLRNIVLSDGDLSRLKNSVDKAASKGARSAVLVMDKAWLVVSVTNRTVITAIDNASLKENIFTHIDCMVIV